MFFIILILVASNVFAQKAVFDTATVLIDTFRVGADTTSVIHRSRTHMSYSFNFSDVSTLCHKIIFEMSDDQSRWTPVDSITLEETCYHNSDYTWYDYCLTASAIPPKEWTRIRAIAEIGSIVGSDNILTVRKNFWEEWK